MRWIRKYDRYLATYFLTSYLICFLFFLGLFIVIDLVAKVDDILEAAPLVREKGQSLLLLTVWCYFLKLPEIFLMVAPYLTVMAAMFCISRLRKNNELLPMVMAGVSLYRILLPVFVLSGMLMLTMVGVQEFLASPCAKARLLSENFLFDHKEQLLIERGLFWDSDGKEIVAKNYDVATQVIGSADISFLEQQAGRSVNYSIRGKNLRWLGPEEAAWSMEEGVMAAKDITDPDIDLQEKPVNKIRTDLTPGDIEMRIKEPSDWNFKEIQRAYAMNTKDLRMKILLHYHLTLPLSNLLLLLLGIPFVLRPEARSNFLGLTIALLICGGYFVLDNIMRDLGTKNHIHPILAAWSASIFCGAVGIYLFDNIKS